MILNKIAMVLLGIILLPFVLVLGPPIACCVAWVALWGSRNPALGCCCCLLFPIPFAIGLILDICWIPFVLIAGPIALIKAACDSC